MEQNTIIDEEMQQSNSSMSRWDSHAEQVVAHASRKMAVQLPIRRAFSTGTLISCFDATTVMQQEPNKEKKLDISPRPPARQSSSIEELEDAGHKCPSFALCA